LVLEILREGLSDVGVLPEIEVVEFRLKKHDFSLGIYFIHNEV
jgi:hypothetical protein